MVLKAINSDQVLNFKKNKKINKKINYYKSFLGYQPTPGVHKHTLISNGKTFIDSTYTIGEDGFRKTSKKYNKVTTPGINFFGGSFVFGWGLNDDETLPHFTQQYLENWNVQNYGINGYGAHQMLTHITKDKSIITDINILITHNSHIPRSACKRDYSFGTPKYKLNNKKQLIRAGYCNNLMFANIQLPKIFGSIINRSEIKKLLDKSFFRKSDFTSNDINLYLSIIDEINKKILEKNNHFFVGYIENNLTDIDKIILKELRKRNIKIIDLTLENNQEYLQYDGHPTKEANIKRSIIIRDYLENSNYKLFN